MANQKTLAVGDFDNHLDLVVQEVSRTHVPCVLTRGDHPEAALVAYDDFLRLQRMQKTEIFSRFDALLDRMRRQSANLSEDEVAADVAAARAELPY